ncbi:MAG: peptidoglycan DD-metalloendopeptidase family protein [Candidatus Coatesbacteria bacterium]|nr:peptidoglycan DD-metalloendopeptidase family protein [Candidatus Coatesbacteria bacterium]
MQSDRFTIIINRDRLLGTYRRDYSRRQVRRLILIVALVLIGGAVMLFFYSDNVRKNLEIFSLGRRDTTQQEQLEAAHDRIASISSRLDDLREVTDVARLLHTMQPVNTTEREGGIGGAELGGRIERFPKISSSPLDDLTQRYYERALRLDGSLSIENILVQETIERARREADIRDRTPSIKPVVGHIISFIGNRIHPITGLIHFHRGIDISAAYGTPIMAPADGTVVFAGTRGGYGTTCFIDHGYGYQTRYGHCSRLNVKEGDEVQRGQVIAHIGSTGMSTGPHLHYEVLVEGSVTNPLAYIYPEYEYD